MISARLVAIWGLLGIGIGPIAGVETKDRPPAELTGIVDMLLPINAELAKEGVVKAKLLLKNVKLADPEMRHYGPTYQVFVTAKTALFIGTGKDRRKAVSADFKADQKVRVLRWDSVIETDPPIIYPEEIEILPADKK